MAIENYTIPPATGTAGIDATVFTTLDSDVVPTGTNFFFGTDDLIAIAAALGITIADPIPDSIPPATPTTRRVVFHNTEIPVGALVGFNSTRIQFGDTSSTSGERLEFRLPRSGDAVNYIADPDITPTATNNVIPAADSGGFVQAIYDGDNRSTNAQELGLVASFGTPATEVVVTPGVALPSGVTITNSNLTTFNLLINS